MVVLINDIPIAARQQISKDRKQLADGHKPKNKAKYGTAGAQAGQAFVAIFAGTATQISSARGPSGHIHGERINSFRQLSTQDSRANPKPSSVPTMESKLFSELSNNGQVDPESLKVNNKSAQSGKEQVPLAANSNIVVIDKLLKELDGALSKVGNSIYPVSIRDWQAQLAQQSNQKTQQGGIMKSMDANNATQAPRELSIVRDASDSVRDQNSVVNVGDWLRNPNTEFVNPSVSTLRQKFLEKETIETSTTGSGKQQQPMVTSANAKDQGQLEPATDNGAGFVQSLAHTVRQVMPGLNGLALEQPLASEINSAANLSNQLRTSTKGLINQITRNLSQNFADSKNEVKQFSIQLQPIELGKIEIEVRWQDGKLHLQCQASEPSTGSALQQGLPDLRHSLESMGITCGSMQMGLGGQAYQDHQPEAPWQIKRFDKSEDQSSIEVLLPVPAPTLQMHRVNLTI